MTMKCPGDGCNHPGACSTITALASVDANHPDYRPEWKP